MTYPGEGLRRLMPAGFREAVTVMIAAMSEQPETNPDVVSAANRACDHIATEVVTIRHLAKEDR